MFMDQFFSRSLPDFLEDLVERLRIRVSTGNPHPQVKDHASQQLEESQPHAAEVKAGAGGMAEGTIPSTPDARFVKMVEVGLRKFPDFITLGQLPLAECMGVKGESQVARGKQLHQLLHAGIESLRPAEARPMGAPPRDWYNYIVLHDAYVTGIRNREVMARLYISEGTFNRTRRNALRGVAMWLLEGTRHVH